MPPPFSVRYENYLALIPLKRSGQKTSLHPMICLGAMVTGLFSSAISLAQHVEITPRGVTMRVVSSQIVCGTHLC